MASPPPTKRARHKPPSSNVETAKKHPSVPSRAPSNPNKPRTINFRYRPNNSTHRWGPDEAFREIVKRWREDIIHLSGMPEENFAVFRQEERGDYDDNLSICYRVFKLGSEPKKFLGHIRYSGTKGQGTVDILTQGLKLDMGWSDPNSRGPIEAKIPDESLETAILVFMMSPQNHKVRLRSRLFDWRFNFNKHGNLFAMQHNIAPEMTQDINEATEDIQRSDGLCSDAVLGQDTQFIFGEPGKGQDEHGNPTTRSQVRECDFRRWARVGLFFWDLSDGGKSMTSTGEIILDDRFSGLLYYDSLLLPRQDPNKSTKRPLRFAYNLPRTCKFVKEGPVLSAGDQARAIIDIWNDVLAVRPMLAAELSAMLNSTALDYGDIAGAENHLTYDVARLLRRHLLGDASKKLWYYTAEEKAKNPDLHDIIERLGCEGRELTRRYWSIMSKHGLLNTAEHELLKRQRTESTVPDWELTASPFAMEMSRLSQACLKLCHSVTEYRVDFVRGTGFDPELSFDHESQRVKIPNTWLVKDRVMADLEIPPQWKEPDVIFHAVYTLFTKLFDLLADDYLDGVQLVQATHDDIGSSKSATQQAKRGILAEIHHRLLAYNRANGQIRLHHPQGDPSALLMSGTALPDTGWASAGHVIEFQLHRDNCEHFRLWGVNDLGSWTVNGGSVGQNNEVSSSDRPSPTCQSVELVCPAHPASYIFAIFEELRARRSYFGLVFNRSDPHSIVIALQGRHLHEKLSPKQQADAERENWRHLASSNNCFAAEPQPPGGPTEEAGQNNLIPLRGARNWARRGTYMIP